jgi:GNAT superfamily N-acetyltransferase
MSTPSIRRVSYSEILGAGNAQELIEEYAAECSIPQLGQVEPQAETYAKLEAAGLMACFAAYEPYDTPAGDVPRLIGFGAVLVSAQPHYGGRKVAMVESLFVARQRRRSGASGQLMHWIEQHAAEAGCVAVLYSAPAYSRFAKVLAASHTHVCTNVVYARGLN